MVDDTSDPVITVESFCATLSSTDKRVELIGAFHHAQTSAQLLFDTATNYQARFVAFCALPA